MDERDVLREIGTRVDVRVAVAAHAAGNGEPLQALLNRLTLLNVRPMLNEALRALHLPSNMDPERQLLAERTALTVLTAVYITGLLKAEAIAGRVLNPEKEKV